MRELAKSICDHLIATYGDVAFVTPRAFANALRVVSNLPEDASPLAIETFVSKYVTLRLNVAAPSVAGFHYDENGEHVIETGQGRSAQERNVTLVHEFGEILHSSVNDELASRGLVSIAWPDKAWDSMALEFVSPLARFKAKARSEGLNLIALYDPLSFEAVVYRLKEAFDTSVPLFALFYRNTSKWQRGQGYDGETWRVGASAWTKRWMNLSFPDGRERLHVPRGGAFLQSGSIVDDVRLQRRPLLVHTADQIVPLRPTEADVIIRPKYYGPQVAQIFVVGVARSHADVLGPQVQLLGADERQMPFHRLFRGRGAVSRRANNDGSIYRRGSDGRWASSLLLPSGKRKHFLGKTRDEVAKKLTAALKSRDDGLPIVNERQTVEQFLNRWMKDKVAISTRPSTVRGYESKVRMHLVPALGKVQLARLTPQGLQAFLNDKLQSGLSPRTVHHLRALLRAALQDAVKWGLVSRNVADVVDPPRVPIDEVQVLAPAEAQQLLGAVRGDRLEALYSVALAMGLRQGEALGLRWEDIDLDARTLSIRRSLQRVSGAFHFVEPKSARSHRKLGLPNIAAAALREHRTRQLQERLRAGPLWEEHALVFTRPNGKPLYGSNVTRDFQRMLEAAGLRRMRFHDMRHACASLLIAQGVHPRIVMETLGHSQIGITMNLYGHVLPEVQRQAAIQMDAVLTGR